VTSPENKNAAEQSAAAPKPTITYSNKISQRQIEVKKIRDGHLRRWPLQIFGRLKPALQIQLTEKTRDASFLALVLEN